MIRIIGIKHRAILATPTLGASGGAAERAKGLFRPWVRICLLLGALGWMPTVGAQGTCSVEPIENPHAATTSSLGDQIKVQCRDSDGNEVPVSVAAACGPAESGKSAAAEYRSAQPAERACNRPIEVTIEF